MTTIGNTRKRKKKSFFSAETVRLNVNSEVGTWTKRVERRE